MGEFEQVQTMTKEEHQDTGMRCLVGHGEGGQCIVCTCGKYVRPVDWEKHKEANDKKS